MTAHHCYFLQV